MLVKHCKNAHKKKLGNLIPSFTVNIKKKEYLLDKRRRRSQRFRLLLLSSVKHAEPTKKTKRFHASNYNTTFLKNKDLLAF